MPILNDVRYGLRLLRKAPGFTAIAVGTIAVAIAANTAIFSVVYATLLAPMPYPHPEQLVMVWSSMNGDRNVVSPDDFEDWQARSAVFQSLHAWSGHTAALSLGDRPEPVWAGESTPGMQTMVGNRFALGRDFLPDEAQPGRDRVLILSNRMWRERFASDPSIVGRAVRLDREPHVVVGVLAPGEADRGESWMTVPLALSPDRRGRGTRFLCVMGRLKPGVSLEEANANLRTVADAIALDHPDTNRGVSAVVQPLQNNFLPRDTVRGLWLLMGAVGFVLLIACANVANLLLARGTRRRREVAVRAALGASRARVFRQLLTESVLLSMTGALVGLALARVALDGILALMPPGTLPLEADVRLNLPVLLATIAMSLLSGIVAGCVPAWQATRTELDTVLRQEGRSAIGGGGSRLRRALVAAEFALALTLLAGASVATGSLVQLVRSDVGFRTDGVLTFGLGLPRERAEVKADREAFLREALERIQALPGVQSAAVSTGSPGSMRFAGGFRIVGDPEPAQAGMQGAAFNMVSADYHATYGLQVERGRAFDARDVEGAPRVAMVSDRFAAQYLQGRDPLAQRLLMQPLGDFGRRTEPPLEWQIVGVFRGARLQGPDSATPEIAVPFWQASTGEVTVAVHTSGDPSALVGALGAVVRALDPDLPLLEVRTIRQRLNDFRAGHRFQAVLFASFAGIALLLAALGIYGVMSFVVAERRHEIGIRMALGADRARMLRLVMREGLATAGAGTALGCGGAYAIARLMQGMWDGAARVDPAAFAIALGTLLASAALACFVPARRAASVDPLAALRDE
jgi:putative ABC transport system permease protein